jgi:hypothetical protein
MISPLRIFLFSMLLLVAGLVSQVPQDAQAQFILNCPPSLGSVSYPYNVHGWLWSSNIGWISLNCSDMEGMGYTVPKFGVSQDLSGNWIGYGWSSNVGWTKFDAGCPSGASGHCNTKMTTIGTEKGLVGWAKFSSASGATDSGWDGWVSMSSENDHNFTTAGVQKSTSVIYGPKAYNGVDVNGCREFKPVGYAWGDDVVGWLAFSMSSTSRVKVCEPAGPVTTLNGDEQCFASNPTNINLSWSTQNPGSISHCNVWVDNGAFPIPIDNNIYQASDSISIPFTSVGTKSYQVSCWDSSGGLVSTSNWATGVTKDMSDPSCSNAITTLSGGGNMCATGSDNPDQTKTLSWTTSNAPTANYCKVYSGGVPIDNINHPTNGSVSVGPFSAGSKDYTVLCFDSSNSQVTTSNTENITILPTSDNSCKNTIGSTSGALNLTGGGSICPSGGVNPSSRTLIWQATRPNTRYEQCELFYKDTVNNLPYASVSSQYLLDPGDTISQSYIASDVGTYQWRCYPSNATPSDPNSYDSVDQDVTEYCATSGQARIISFSGGGPLCPAGSVLVINQRTLSWSSANTSSCTLTYPDGSVHNHSGSGTAVVTQTGNYTLSCTDGVNTDTATQRVEMFNLGVPPCNGQPVNTRPKIKEI